MPRITGLKSDSDLHDAESLWKAAFTAQARMGRLSVVRNNQRIEISEPGQPFALAFLSDLHFGSAGTDYRQAKKDAELIRDTPRLYAIYHGDGIDNWITGKLMRLQRGQVLEFDGEIQLFAAWIELLKGKLVAAVSGNHENWTHVLSGFDRIREALRGTQTLVDRHEVIFDLAHGKKEWKVKVRHYYKYFSVFNPTHSIEVNWERGGTEFDIGVGGHTHIGTLCRPFYRQGRKRFAILTGTYKVSDEYGRQIAAAPSMDRGCGALVFSRHGLFWSENLQIAAGFLGYLFDGR